VFFYAESHLRERQLDAKWVTVAPLISKKNQPGTKQAAASKQSSVSQAGVPATQDQAIPQKTATNLTTASVPARVSPAEIEVTQARMPNPQSAVPAAQARNPAQAQGQTKEESGPEDQGLFQLKVSSNLVLAHVVVRDANGKPVVGLKKEDFKLFDRGKAQSITQFEVESRAAAVANDAAVRAQKPGPAAAPAMPGEFLAFYFDDLDTPEVDMIQARDAADQYLAAKLHANERAAIFTSSKTLSDFTDDPKQIHEALAKLHSSPRSLARTRECPDLSDYQAQQIDQFPDDKFIDAWRAAQAEAAARCPMSDEMILSLARSMVSQAQIQTRTNLQELDRLVQYLSHMPGQRAIVLVSPGFMSQGEQYQLDRLIDRALRMQVVISSLDPMGLPLLMREVDVTKNYTPSANSGVINALHNVDSTRERVASDVLAEVAQGTGGEFFHNNNDLKAGFGALAGSPVYYILAFAPSDIKPDGKFHSLKVELSNKAKGLTIQARRGYFVPKSEAEAKGETNAPQASDPEAQAEEQIREGVMAKTESWQLPVELRTEVSKGPAGSNELAVSAHLDTKTLHFHKEGERNQNTVTFVFVIFDRSGDYVTGQQRQAKVNLPDDSLSHLLTAGMDIKVTFQLKPGTYTVREVVTDAEDHLMTTFSCEVQVP
jgi:VWFA-related protein